MLSNDAIARLREGDLGDTPFGRLSDGDERPSLFRAWTRATLDALQVQIVERQALRTGDESAAIFSVPNALGGEPANLLVVQRNVLFVDVAAAHDIKQRQPVDFDFSGNVVLRALSAIPGSPVRTLKRNIAATRAALPLQQLVMAASSLALEAAWPRRLPMRGFAGGGRPAGAANFASYSATRDEWDALDVVQRERVCRTLAEVTRRLCGLTTPDAPPAEMAVGIVEAPEQQQNATARRIIHRLDTRDMPWLWSTTVVPTVWRSV